MKRTAFLLGLCLLLCQSLRSAPFPLGNGFSYQGRLTEGGNPANGVFDFYFELFDAPLGGTFLGALELEEIEVTNGLFVVELDFGAGQFNGQARWLQLSVQGTNGLTLLSPRQPLGPAPYALFSPTAGRVTNGAITSTMLATGAVTTSALADAAVTSAKLAPGVTITNIATVTNILSLGAGNLAGRLDVYRTAANTPALTLAGSNSQMTVFAQHGGELARLGERVPFGGVTNGSLRLNALAGGLNRTFVELTANSLFGGFGALSLNGSNGNQRASLFGDTGGGSLSLYQPGLIGNEGARLSAGGGIGGLLLLKNTNGETRATLAGTNNAGTLHLFQSSGSNGVSLSAALSRITTYGSDGLEQTRLWGSSFGELLLYNGLAANEVSARLTTESGLSGALFLNDSAGNSRTILRANGQPDANSGGSLFLNQPNGSNGVWMYANGAGGLNPGGLLRIFQGNGLDSISFVGNAQQMSILNPSARESARLAGPTHGELLLKDGTGANNTGARLHSQPSFSGLELRHSGVLKAHLVGDPNAGGLALYNPAGAVSVLLDGNTGKTTTKVLQITGGADLSEQFDVGTANEVIQPGMVVCIDPRTPGTLVVSTKAHDRTVAGIVSGAGGVSPGMLMGQQGTLANGKHPIALTGRVYCLADARQAAIHPGDLLTTSEMHGHAMKVTDHAKAQGAIIGKAMTGLEKGSGLVLVLVSLQ